MEEVVVTAQKREESLQEVPIAITALGAEAIERSGLYTMEDLATQVPNMQFGSFNTLPAISLRGISYENTTPGGDPGVSFHVDGVYMSQPVSALTDAWDIERLEVLRGPQGTLYGRNATGGSVNFISQKPVDTYEGKLDFTYGNFDHIRLRGIVNAPLHERVKLRVSAAWEERDGYQKNIFPGGRDGNDKDNVTVRGQLLFTLSDNVDLLVSASHAEIGGAGIVSETRFPFPSCAPPRPCAVLPTGIEFGGPGPANQPQLVNDLRPNRVNKDTRETNDQTFTTVSGTLSWDLGFATFKSITAYAETAFDTYSDLDLSERPIMDLALSLRQDQFTQEVQLASEDDQRLRWLVGAFYFTEDADRRSTAVNDNMNSFAANSGIGFVLRGAPRGWSVGGDVEAESIAGFTQLDFDLTDTITLTGGFRFTRDEKTANLNEFSPFAPVGNFVPPAPDNPCPCLIIPGRGLVPFAQVGGPPIVRTGNLVASDTESWSEPTYKFSINWSPWADVNFYALYSRGYKSGGANLNSATIADAFYDPEFVDSYEAGVKAQFMDRLSVNLTGFHNEIDDLQFQIFGPGGAVIDNAASATVDGIESEVVWIASDYIEFNGSLGWMKAEYDEFMQRVSTTIFADRSGNQLNRAPDWTINFGGQYRQPLGSLGELTLRFEYHWQDEQFYLPENTETVRAPSYHNLNLRAMFQSSDGHWTVEAFMNNVTDETQVGYILRSIPFLYGGLDNSTINPPRMYGLRIGYQFF